MYFDIYGEEYNAFTSHTENSLFDIVMMQNAYTKKQKMKEAEEKRNAETKNDRPIFFMKFDSEVDRLYYMCASSEDKERIKQKQMEERGFIEEVVETVKEIATRTASGLRRRMNIINSMIEKKSYSLLSYNVLESALDAAFNKAKEISAMVTNRIALAADNATFNRSIFPNTS